MIFKEKSDFLKKNEVSDEAVESSVVALLAGQKNIPSVLYRRRERSNFQLEGENLSSLKGQGMTFEEVRPYQVGDDIRRIDWRVTAKQGRPYTKLFRQEKERPVFILSDFQNKMKFGTFGCFKSVLAAKIAAFLIFLFDARKEKTGMVMISTDKVEYFQPKRDKASVLSFIAALSRATRLKQNPPVQSAGPFFETTEKNQNNLFLKSLLNLDRLVSSGVAVFIISDFSDMNDSVEKALLKLASKCDVSLIHISDALENRLPESGEYFLTDKTDVLLVDMKDKKLQNGYLEYFQARREHLVHLCRQHKMKLLFLRTDEKYEPLLSRFLKKGV